MHSRWPACLVALTSLACASTPEVQDGQVIVTENEYRDIERGPGAEHCTELDAAYSKMQAQDFDEAEELLDGMIERYEAFVAQQGGVAVSTAGPQEFEQVRAEAGNPAQLVPVDFCYREVLHRKAFALAAQERFEDALRVLDEEARIAPAAAAPYVERGYVLNRIRRPAEAKASYERALALSEKFPASAPHRPAALRGLGYALIELGDLDAAEEAFAQSLELEPGNALAISELEYIQKIRAGR